MNMNFNNKKIDFCGLDANTLFRKLDNDMVYATNKEDVKFKPNREEQLEFALWVTLIFNANPLGLLSDDINGLVEMLGYVPNKHKGKINERVKNALESLKRRLLLQYREVKGKYYINIDLAPSDGDFFKLYYSNIIKILNLENHMFDDSLDGKIKQKLSHYKDRTKALYVYCYLLSRMGVKQSELGSMELCFPTLDQISEDCNIDIKTLRRLLALFEMDDLIYTINLGGVLLEGKRFSNNYYTTSLSCSDKVYDYARVYYKSKGFEVESSYLAKKRVVNETNALLEKAINKLSDVTFTIDGEEIEVLPIFNTMIENNFYKLLDDSSTSVTKASYEIYIRNCKFQKSKFITTTSNKSLLFLMDKSGEPTLLIHYYNTIKGICSLFGVYV